MAIGITIECISREAIAKLRQKVISKWRIPGDASLQLPPSEYDRRLCEQGICSENELLSLYCEALNCSPLDENTLETPEVIEEITADYFIVHSIIPYSWNDTDILLLISDPYMLFHHSAVFQGFWNKKVRFVFARHSLVERMIRSIYNNQTEHGSNTIANNEDALRQLAGDARIVRLVNEMMTQALEANASDIHVEPEEQFFKIRFRIDGVLEEYLSLEMSEFPAVASRIKLIGGLNIAESRLPQDGRTNFKVGHYDMDIRISTIPLIEGESIVLRLLRKDAMQFDLHNLGMSDETLKRFADIIRKPHGIILVVGPTGSGKTTTLYSAMQHLNDHKRKIITIEDPVEYLLPGLSQMQVNPKIGLNFASGLRHIVRQDPDVILVGEIRDRETADIAINAALTGHLVFSTLHTNDAVGAITRLLDMGVEGFLVSSALIGVLSQRLVRKKCAKCGGVGDYNGIRCKNCHGTGYRGRIGIYELLLVDDELSQGIMKNIPAAELNRIAIRNGMIPLIADGHQKIKAGITTEQEIRCASGDVAL